LLSPSSASFGILIKRPNLTERSAFVLINSYVVLRLTCKNALTSSGVTKSGRSANFGGGDGDSWLALLDMFRDLENRLPCDAEQTRETDFFILRRLRASGDDVAQPNLRHPSVDAESALRSTSAHDGNLQIKIHGGVLLRRKSYGTTETIAISIS
jgi:hypothetical protein